MSNRVAAVAVLEYPGITLRVGYAAWNDKGRLLIAAAPQAAMWRRKPAYFRVNETGKFYAVLSRHHTEEIPATAIQWAADDGPQCRKVPRNKAKFRL